MKHAQIAGLTNRESKMTVEEMMVAVGESLTDLASSINGEDGEDEDDEGTEQGKLSEDEEPSGVMDTIIKTIQQGMKWFQQK